MSGRALWLPAAPDGDATALVTASRSWTRQELAERADALASWLRERGVGPGDVVAALLPNGVGFATLLHAVDRLGATLLPLNTRLTPKELAHPLHESRARWVLHDGGPLQTRAEDAARLARSVEAAALPDAPPRAERTLQAPGTDEDAFAALYTSGTTGRPKGALLSHAALRASADASRRHLGGRDDDRWLACMPLFHVGGLSILLRAALDGTPVHLHERFDAGAVNDALDRDAITHASLVPTMLERLLDARDEAPAPPTLRCVLLGGAGAPKALLERASKLGFPIAPTYGLTEAASQVATQPPGDEPLSGAAPLPGVELRIVTRDGADAPAGEPGEILVRGPNLMSGYLHRPDASAETLRDGWLHTGDVGRLDAAGRLHPIDRRDDLIVSGGENVYPAEVEAVLCEHPAVTDAAVTALPDGEFGSRPSAWIVCGGGVPEDLERFCRERLAGYKIPVRFRALDALPRTASGKLRRAELRRR